VNEGPTNDFPHVRPTLYVVKNCRLSRIRRSGIHPPSRPSSLNLAGDSNQRESNTDTDPSEYQPTGEHEYGGSATDDSTNKELLPLRHIRS
jgi:hypothetical protein